MTSTAHSGNTSLLLPSDYLERVYAGVLGKMIGVYLGRPFEGWTYEQISHELGEITYFVHEKLGVPLVVSDDDLSGTFTFVRALSDYRDSPEISPAQIGQTWLNYIIEQRTILWWGGIGTSTEHTAYLRLKAGIPAPQSGSIARNGQVVAEQIGAQIFIDGWGMIAAGDPALAAELARKAGSVSHDGEAIYAAQVIAAMEAAAFVEPDLNRLLDIGLSFIPSDSLVATMIRDIRAWHLVDGDWRKTRERIAAHYGYDRYGGGCHVIPNHALIILALLYGGDDFQRSLMIVNTCGWDTDCNSGNVGCLLAIKNGLRALEGGPDWRGPIADRLYIPTADGGSCITDAVQQTYHLAVMAHALRGLPFTSPPRFNFSFPGSIQGFHLSAATTHAKLSNTQHPVQHRPCLGIEYQDQGPVELATHTFLTPDANTMPVYTLIASPTLYSGQIVDALLLADAHNIAPVQVQLFIRSYQADDHIKTIYGPPVTLAPSQSQKLQWQLPSTQGAPILEVGLALHITGEAGKIYLEHLDWHGAPHITLKSPIHHGQMWQRSWIDALDEFSPCEDGSFRLIQNSGRGLLIYGTRDWHSYHVSATLTPHLAEVFGLALHVQGLRRYYALLLVRPGQVQLVKVCDGERALATVPFQWEFYHPYSFSIQSEGTRILAWLDDQLLFDLEDEGRPLSGGGIALVCQEGRITCDNVTIHPSSQVNKEPA